MPTASKKADRSDSLRFLAEQKPYLRMHKRVLTALRAFFDTQEYLEIQTPVAVSAPAPEAYIEAPSCSLGRFLRPSPELEMKRMLAAGYEEIYQIGPCFRENENGRCHNSEFTLLEWYCAGQTYEEMQLFIRKMFAYLDTADIVGDGRDAKTRCGISLDIKDTQVLTVAEAFERYARADVNECIANGTFEETLCSMVEPHLGKDALTLLVDYPASQAAFSRLKNENPQCAERFEVYLNGIELANAYGELTDPKIQRERFAEFDAIRLKNGGKVYPAPTQFLEALDYGIPPSAGAALGVDRLVMFFSNAPAIDYVRACM